MIPPSQRLPAQAWRGGAHTATTRAVPEETPVALVYDWTSYAVMMATPADLEDFALGFSLAEGIIATPEDIAALEIVPHEAGVECRMMLRSGLPETVRARRRASAGPVGCGLCGIEDIAQALRPLPVVTATPRLPAEGLRAAFGRLSAQQRLNQETRAVHAAAFWRPGAEALLVREDVGRHNALDKLVGAMARAGESAATGAVLLTSRVSVELVQKAALMGAPVLAAVSVPTALAVREADKAGITLVAVARDDGFEIFTHPERIILEAQSHVA